jgi:hypothetical protein
MPTLRDEINAILARTADEIVDAVLRQLGAGTGATRSPTAPRSASPNGAARRRRARMSDDALGDAVRDFVRFVRGKGDEGAPRAELMDKFGWDASAFNKIKAAAIEQGEIKQKGDKRLARYVAK